MKALFVKLWDHLVRLSVLDTDSPRERRRKVTLVVIAILSCLEGVWSTFNSIAGDEKFVIIMIPIVYIVVVGSSLLVFFLTKRFSILLYPFLIMILVTPVFFQTIGGGFSQPGTISIILWSLLAPFGALMFQSVRKAVWWFIAYMILVVMAMLYDGYWGAAASDFMTQEILKGQGVNIIGLSVTIFITMLYFVHAFQKEHARAETALKELKETQAELIHSGKMAALGKLVAGMAHEMNTPIGALKSATDVSNRSVEMIIGAIPPNKIMDESPQVQKALRIIKKNKPIVATACDRISELLDSFKNFSRLDEADLQKVDIHEGIDSTLVLLERELGQRIEVIKMYGEIPEITCFPGELNQVFLNILTNAIQSIKDEGQITINTYSKDDTLQIQFNDSGGGISPEKMVTLFDPEFSNEGDRVRAELGLFTSYRIMQKHQGEIRVDSEVGRGSTFTVIIPENIPNTLNGSELI